MAQQNNQDDPFLSFLQEVDQGKASPPQAQPVTAGSQAGGGGEGVSQSAQTSSPSTPPTGDRGTAASFASGFADTISFGFADEIGGFLTAVVPGSQAPGTSSFWSSGKSFGDTVAANTAALRAEQAFYAENRKVSHITGQVGGAIVIPMGAGAKGALQVSRVGAVQGAVYGIGSGEGVQGRLTEGVKDAAIGGVTGGVLGKLGDVIGPRISKLLGRTKEGTPTLSPEQEAAATSFWNGQRGNKELSADDVARWYDDQGIPKPTAADIEKGIQDAQKGASFSGLPAEAKPVGILGETQGGQLILREATQGADQAAEELTQREALSALQREVEKGADAIRTKGERAEDITWATAPDVTSRTGEFRLGNLSSSEEAVATLRKVTEGTVSKGVRSDAELAQAAQAIAGDIGEDPQALLALGREIAGKLGDADTSMMALRSVWAKASENVTDFHLMNVNWATASDELVDEAAQRIFNLSQLSHLVQEAKTGLGRGLRANKLPTAEEYLARVKKGGAETAAPGEAKLPATREELSDWFDLWGATGGDPKRQADFLQGLLTVPPAGKYLRQSFANFFTASILSAPRTVALNVIGPGAISVIRNIERFTGAGMMSLNPIASAAERKAARAVASNTAKAYIQTFGDIQDAFRQALVAAERNHTLIGGGSQTVDALASYGPLTDNLLRAAGSNPSRMQQMGYSLGNLINVWPKAFARLNNGLDEFSKRLAYQGEVRINAMVEAAEQGLDGQAARDFVENAMKNAYDEVGMARSQELLRSAERTTLTARVGEDGSRMREFGNYVQKLRGEIPELRYIVPVFNVPVNALGETLRRLPIAGIPGLNKVMFAQTAKELAGELGPVAQADAHGRMMLGAAFLTAGYMMNQQGVLTGAGPQDPTDRKAWLLTHQPYSIRLGDQWVRYDKFDIMGGLLSIPATVADSTIYNPDDKGVEEALFAGVGALAQWFKDRAALRSATGLLALGDDPTKSTERTFQNTLGAITSGFYPAAARTLLTDGTTNPYIPMRRSWQDYVEAALPFNSVEPIRNILGEPIRKSLDSVTEAIVPVSTVPTVTYKDDPVLDELDRLYTATGYGAGADSTAFSYGFFSDKDLKLESGQSFYGRAMQLRQTVKIDGMTLREALADLFNSAEYAEGVDGSTSRKSTTLGEANRPKMVSALFTEYNKEIKRQLAAESPIAESYMTAANAKRIDQAYLRNVSVEDLVKNPDLYRANGVERSAYEVGGGETQALLDALR